MIEIIANAGERQRSMTCITSADLEQHEGGHWRVQRDDLDPATIYARYARARARRGWAIAIIALLSGLSWVVLSVLVIAVLSGGLPISW